MKPQDSSTVALIAAYNEAGHVGKVVRGALRELPRVLVVDDGSTDATANEAAAAGAEVIRHPQNMGKGAAIATGLARCRELGCEWILLLDADGQHDPAEIPQFLDAGSQDGVMLVLGNRMTNVWTMPLMRRIGNRFGSWLISRLCRMKLSDTQCGFRLLHRSAADTLSLTTQHYEVDSEMLIQLARAGHRIVSVPIKTIYANEKSRIRPWSDAVRFTKLVVRYWLYGRDGTK